MTSDFARRSYGSFERLGPGRRIAGYLIEAQIGAGGMAEVFRARDEVLGRLASSGDRAAARTAYLHTDFRSITPVGEELAVHAWFVSEHGRKRLLRATITHGETLCAEAEALFIELRPDQP